MMATWKLAPCLASGNCIVLKCSEVTPLTCLYFAQLTKEAGFPPGVVNILAGYGPTVGERLTRHPDIPKVSFTGSTLVGRKVMNASSETNLKKVSVEAGGKSPVIIAPDCDWEHTIEECWN